MLKVMVCFKIVADLDMLANDNWIINADNSVDTSFVKKELNSCDESVLEMALKLADISQPIETTALTIGDKSCDRFLKNMYAINYDKAVCISVEADRDLRFNPLQIANLISQYQQVIGKQNLIILGSQSDDGQNGQTPLFLAELLHWPCITQVTDITLTDCPNYLTITSLQSHTTLVQTVKLPIVLAIGDAVSASSLRIPTLKSKLNAAKKVVEHYPASDFSLNTNGNDKELIKLYWQKNNQSCLFIEGNDALEKAKILYEYHLKQRLEK